jgi:hypothetical protein
MGETRGPFPWALIATYAVSPLMILAALFIASWI